jgi:beta-lactamase class A
MHVPRHLFARIRQSIQPVVDACAGKHKGMLRIVVKDLASGDTARLNDGSRFSFASLYKLFVMQAAADQAGQSRTP